MIETNEPRPAGRLLVVDDEPDVLQALVQTLELEGYAVSGYSSGQQALAALRSGGCDVLLTDLFMPGLDGLGLLRAGLELDPDLVGLIMSGKGSVASAVEALQLGAFDYLLKPYNVEALLQTVRRALNVRQVRLENVRLRETVALYDLSQAIAVALEAATVAQQTVDAALQQMGADEAALLTLEPGGEALVVAAVAAADSAGAAAGADTPTGSLRRAELVGQRVPLAHSIAGWIARQAEPLLLNGPVKDERFAPRFPRPAISSAIGVPMIAGGRVVGVLTVNALGPRRAFTPGQLKGLRILANAGAAALANAALVADLRASEARYRELIEHASDGIVTISPEGQYLEANSLLLEWLGYSREEFLRLTLRDVVVPEDLPGQLRDMDRMRAGQVVRNSRRLRRKDGSALPVELSARRLPDGNFQAFLRDITERQRAEQALRDSEARFATLFQASPAAITVSDLDGRILDVNAEFERAMGYRRDEAVGRQARELGTWALSEERERVLQQLSERGKLPGLEVQYRRKSGETMHALSSFEVVEVGGQKLILTLALDISETKQRQREMEAIAAVSAALRGVLTRAQIEQVILDELTELLQASAASLTMVDPTSDGLLLELGKGRWTQWSGTRDDPGVGIMGHVLSSGEPYVTADAAHDPLYFPPGGEPGIVGAAVAPLIAHGQTIGGLAVGRDTPFSESELRLLRSVADIAANAVQRATLHEQTLRRAEQLAAVNEMSRALGETLLLEQIYERLDAATRRLLPRVSSVAISLYDAELQLLLDVYRAQDGQPLPGALAQPPEAAVINAQAQVISQRQPVIISQPAGEPAAHSSLFAPLLAKGAVVGVLQAEGEGRHPFGPDDAELLATVANTAAVAIENARLFAETQRRLLRLQALRTIDLAITSSMDANISLRVLVDQAARQLQVDAVDVLLLDAERHRLELATSRGFKTIPHFALRVDEGNAGRAFMERRLRRVPRLPGMTENPARAQWLAAEGFVAYFGMPLVAKGQARGVLEVFQRGPLAPNAEWLDFLETLAEQAAIALDNSALFADLQRSNMDLELAYDTTLEGWSRALDLRDKETEGHTQRVTELTERLARTMGLPETEMLHIRRGALLHDIGKMGIPDSILLKAGPLTDEEWAVMRKHPSYAFELLAPIPYLRAALDIPYCHHEKWDGTGYPRGLKREQIPLAARVFAVIDVWDALRSDRPYRPAWPEEKVREYIREMSGTHFDPRVASAFMGMVQT